MQENIISAMNSVSYTLSLVLLLSTFMKRSRVRWVIAFVIILAAEMWLAEYIKFQSTILLIPVSAAALWSSRSAKEKAIRHIYMCGTGVYIIWIMTMLLASPFMIFTPLFHNSAGFNLLFAAALPVCALVMKMQKDRTIRLFLMEYGAGYSISIQLVVLLFFNLLMPSIRFHDSRVTGMVIFSFGLVLVFVSLLHNRLTTEAVKARELAAANRQAIEYCRQVQDKYEAIITVMHYLPKLYATLQTYIQQRDYEGLQSYFTKQVSPVFDTYISERHSIDNIEDERLKNLVQITYGQVCMTMKQITPELRIDGIIRIPGALSIIVFESMSNLVDNALQHLRYQQQGYFKLALTAEDNDITMSVTNSLDGDTSVSELYCGQKESTGRGFGLRRVRQIAVGTSDIELFTYKRGQFEGMLLLTQEIKISLGD